MTIKTKVYLLDNLWATAYHISGIEMRFWSMIIELTFSILKKTESMVLILFYFYGAYVGQHDGDELQRWKRSSTIFLFFMLRNKWL